MLKNMGTYVPHIGSEPTVGTLVEFTDLLLPVQRAWGAAVTRVLTDFDLLPSVSSAVILASRHGGNGVPQGVLAHKVGVNSGAMTRILDKAAAANLLERRYILEDRRVRMVHVLPEGFEFAQKMDDAIVHLRAILLGDLPIGDIETAARVLSLFERRIGVFLQRAHATNGKKAPIPAVE